MINADAAIREATALAEEMSKENILASQAKGNEGLAFLEEAQQDFSQAEAAYPSLDLAAFKAYVAKRIESQQAALAADEAYLSRNKEELEAQNSRYNALEEEAAALAQKLGEDDPEQIVALRFYEEIEADQGAYEAERLKAGNADAFLREYLGTAS